MGIAGPSSWFWELEGHSFNTSLSNIARQTQYIIVLEKESCVKEEKLSIKHIFCMQIIYFLLVIEV